MDSATLTTVASIIAGVGGTMLSFRIQRELQMHEQGEPPWIPYADWLLISTVMLSLFLVILPLVAFSVTSPFVLRFARAACTAITIMVGGYIFSLLAHYRLIFGQGRSGPRDNPEPAERRFVQLTTVLAVALFVAVLTEVL